MRDLLAEFIAEYRSWLDAHPYAPGDGLYNEAILHQDRALGQVNIWFTTRTGIHAAEDRSSYPYGYEPAEALRRIRADLAAREEAVREIEAAHAAWIEPLRRMAPTVPIGEPATVDGVPSPERLDQILDETIGDEDPVCPLGDDECEDCASFDVEQAHVEAFAEDWRRSTPASGTAAAAYVEQSAYYSPAVIDAIGAHLAEQVDTRLSLDEARRAAVADYWHRSDSVRIMTEVPTQEQVDAWAAEHSDREVSNEPGVCNCDGYDRNGGDCVGQCCENKGGCSCDPLIAAALESASTSDSA